MTSRSGSRDRRLPIDLGQATAVGSILLVVVFLAKVFAVARYSLTTTTGLVAAAPLQVLLGTIAMYAYLVLPALALGLAWLGVVWWRDPDRACFPVATWPIVAGIVGLTALLSPTEFFVTGAALVAACLRLELRLRPPTRVTVPARWLLLAFVAASVAGMFHWHADLRVSCLVLVVATVAVDTALTVWRTPRLARRLRGRTFLALGSVAVLAYLMQTVEVPWMPAQVFVLSYPAEISTQDKSIAPRVLSPVRVGVLEGYLHAENDNSLTVLEADTRRMVRIPRDGVVAMPLCHRDRDQLPGKSPLRQRLTDVRYNSPNITCETLRESLVPPRGLAFQPDGRILAGVGWDGAFGLWDRVTGKSLGTVPAAPDTRRVETAAESGQVPFPTAFSPDGKWLAVAGVDGTVRLWNPRKFAAPLHVLPAALTLTNRAAPVSALAFSRDGKTLAVAAADTATLFETKGFTRRRTFTPAAGQPVNAVAFAGTDPARPLLAAGGADGRLTLWDTASAATEPFDLWTANRNEIYAIAVAPDGRTIATAGGRREVARKRFSEPYEPDAHVEWRTIEKPCVATIVQGHTGAVNALAFTPDGRRLASGSSDATVRLWSIADVGTVTTLEGHTGAVDAVAFAPDGKTLASTGTDQTIRLWSMDTAADRPRTITVLNPPGPSPAGEPGHRR